VTHLLRVKVPVGDVLASDREDLDIAAEAVILAEREEGKRERKGQTGEKHERVGGGHWAHLLESEVGAQVFGQLLDVTLLQGHRRVEVPTSGKKRI
jgi:hypothetical protein